MHGANDDFDMSPCHETDPLIHDTVHSIHLSTYLMRHVALVFDSGHGVILGLCEILSENTRLP